MRMTFLMKTAMVMFLVTIGTIFISEYSSPAHANATGAQAGETGSPGDASNCSSCHSGATSTNTGVITSNIPTSGYIPGNTYTITATINATSINKFGFQISPQNTSGNLKGTMVAINATETQLISSGKYITHKSAGTVGSGTRTWSFKWIAPAAGAGGLTFYGAFVLANSNNTTSGDQVKLSSMPVSENLTASIAETNMNADDWNVYPNPANDKLFINKANEDYEITSVSINDVAGKLIKIMYSYEVFQAEYLDISDLPKGIYILNITTKTGIATKKIIKY